MKRIFAAALCALALVSASFAASTSSDAIVRLLKSRASGSRSEFKEAAKIVAAGAKEGRPLQQYVIALVTNDRDLPRKLRLKPETRKEYLDQARDKIRRLAEEKNNLAKEQLSLSRAKFERDTTRLFIKWAQNKDALALATDRRLGSDEKTERLGRLMFGDLWESSENGK